MCKGCHASFHQACLKGRDLTGSQFCGPCYNLNNPEWKVQEAGTAECWGTLTGDELTEAFSDISKISRCWAPNLFKVPFGSVGRSFVDELTRLANLFCDREDSRRWSLSGLVLAPLLLLQKPSKNSKEKDHANVLKKRLELWKEGDFEALVREVAAIQKPLKYREPSQELCNKKFVELMREGRVTEATGWLNPDRSSSGVKNCDESVLEELQMKHPDARPANSTILREGPTQPLLPVKFDNLTGTTVYKCAKGLRGSGGPSGLDSTGIHRLLCSRKFKKASPALCTALAKVARTLATERVDVRSLDVFCASRLIPLCKTGGGTRPIGIGECFRRVISKAVVQTIKLDIKEAAGKVQLSAGQIGGVEAAVHALNSHFQSDNCDGVLLLDAQNAFNNMNRRLALKNMSFYCPDLSTFLQNVYGKSRLLFAGEHTFFSAEGATQGDPCAMDFYSIGILRLIELAETPDILQLWYADDGNAAGKIESLLEWYNKIETLGPHFGYFVNPSKCVLIVKPHLLDTARDLFGDTGVQVTAEGARHLGATIGSVNFKRSFVSRAVSSWCSELENLINIAKAHPHLAYANFVKSFKFKWCYMQRTIPDIAEMFQPLEDMIRSRLIPCFTGRQISDLEREVLELPPNLGGMGLDNPVSTCERAFMNSRALTKPLVDAILSTTEEDDNIFKIEMESKKERQQITKDTDAHNLERLKQLQSQITCPKLQRCLELNGEVGASIWLTAIPYRHLGFELHQLEFVDSVCLRYGFEVRDLKSVCECGKQNSADHALSCAKGGYTILRHDGIRDLVAEMCVFVGLKAVQKEKLLQPCDNHALHFASNLAPDARMDVVANGLWRPFQTTYFDVRVFHPNSTSYLKTPIKRLYRMNEAAKNQAYGRRVREVEGGSCTPLVMSTSGVWLRSSRRHYDGWHLGWRCELKRSTLR